MQGTHILVQLTTTDSHQQPWCQVTPLCMFKSWTFHALNLWASKIVSYIDSLAVMGMPGAPWSMGPKHGKLRAGSSEHLRSKICMGMEGLASAWVLCPHGLLVPYFGRTRLGQGPAQVHGNKS